VTQAIQTLREPQVILKVAINTPLPQLFDYLPPTKRGPQPQPGQRVRVPFGRREQIGLLVDVTDTSAVAVEKLRAAAEIIDAEPVLDKELLALLNWATRYYQYPPGEVIAAALPTPLRKGAPAQAQPVFVWELTDAGHAVDLAALERKASVQAALLTALREVSPCGENELRETHAQWRKIISTLSDKGWVEQREIDVQLPATSAAAILDAPELTAGQAHAVDNISAVGFRASLLEGVTGSGKTEVYLQLIAKQLAAGRQSLVLVPEIGLTPQLVSRFRERIPGHIAVVHSGLTPTQRMTAWLSARSGEAVVIIGTRSAIFTPLLRPGLIVVDEEHDASFKQQDGFRYSARDLAVFRAKQLDIPVVLGSATPAFESLNHALAGRYEHLRLPERPGNAEQPVVHVIDLRHNALQEGLSQPFIQALRTHLESGGQALVYLNRRGFAPVLLCPDCGTTLECQQCDARLVLHQRRQHVSCHHCGHERPAPTQCTTCQKELVAVGLGTERLEQAMEKWFPEYPLVRLDRDTTRKRGELENLLEQIRTKQARILLGTQMLTKGHDFPDVSFVGIVDSDQGLFGTDFRSSERLAQSILQVAGRAGRGDRPGEVWIQSYYPEHPLLRKLLDEGYDGFAEQALAERAAAGWPPFSHLVLLRAECAQRDVLFRFLEQARRSADQLLSNDIRALGPATSPMERRSGRYRAQVLIQSANRHGLHSFLPAWRAALANLPDTRRTRWSLDVDPVELF
jgi:primosomal protein N' (replication factor Y)